MGREIKTTATWLASVGSLSPNEKAAAGSCVRHGQGRRSPSRPK